MRRPGWIVWLKFLGVRGEPPAPYLALMRIWQCNAGRLPELRPHRGKTVLCPKGSISCLVRYDVGSTSFSRMRGNKEGRQADACFPARLGRHGLCGYCSGGMTVKAAVRPLPPRQMEYEHGEAMARCGLYGCPSAGQAACGT